MMKRILAAALLLYVFTGSPAFSAVTEEAPSGRAVVIDIMLVRPLSLAATVIGAGVFIIGLPFTIPSSSVDVAARKLIVEPFRFTFARPLGEEMRDY
jgi:hypothetical protein